MSTPEPLVIIGQDMAVIRFLEAIADFAQDRFAIAVISSGRFSGYCRNLLSRFLFEEMEPPHNTSDLASIRAKRGIIHIHGADAAAIDRANHFVKFQNGFRLAYSKLIFATGSFIPAFPGNALSGVKPVRNMAELHNVMRGINRGSKAVVTGSGPLAVEAGSDLAAAGANVTLIDKAPWLLRYQADWEAAFMLQKSLESKGIKFLLRNSPVSILGRDQAEALQLACGACIEAEHIICANERRPNVAIAQKAGLAINQGIIVDDGLRTSDPDIYALGDCAEHHGIADCLIETAFVQAGVLARRLSGEPDVSYQSIVRYANFLEGGIPIFSAGDFTGQSDCLSMRNRTGEDYQKLVIVEEKLVGVMLYGDTSEWQTYLHLIRSQAPVSALWNRASFLCYSKGENAAA